MNKRGSNIKLTSRDSSGSSIDSSKITKKAQVTFYIIIGIAILVFVVISGVFLANLGGDGLFNNKDKDAVYIYTESCIEDVAKQGVFVLGTSGGYIDIPEKYVEQGAYLDMGGRIPYWYYKGFDRVPSRDDMAVELAEYIDDNVFNCLVNYEDFKDRFDISFENTPESEVIITDSKIYVTTKAHIKINEFDASETSRGASSSIREFSIDFDSALGKNHELAKKIMDLENDISFLEDYTDEMIAVSDYLPYEGSDLTCSPKVWMESDLEEYTKQQIMHNLNFLMFEGTSYQKTGMPYYDKQYNIPLFSKTSKTYKDVTVKVIYNPNWDTEFKVSPSKSGIVKSFEMKLGDIIPLCIQVMHHKYTMEYPVVFQLIDKENPEEPFYFSTPVLMKNSQPNRNNEAPDFLRVKDEYSEDEFCQDRLEYSYFRMDELGFMHLEKSTFQNMKNEIDVYAIDMLKGFPEGVISGANISYQCVDFRCNLGATNFPISNEGLFTAGYPLYSGRVPDCLNGMFIAEKEGYYRGITHHTVSDETNKEQVNVELYPLKKIMYGITVIEDHNNVISERGLEEGEKVVITLTNRNLTEYEETVVIPSSLDYYKDLELPLGELDMTYDLNIKLLRDDVYLGGMEANWTPSTEELYSSSFITFYAIKKDPVVPPSTPEEWQVVLDYAKEKSKDYPPDIS